MKKHIFNILIAGAMLPFAGCSDFLEVEPLNVITIDKFWNEEADVVSSISGCYSALQGYDAVSRMLIWGEFRSENTINNGTIDKDPHLQLIFNENLTASNNYTNWSAFYDVINRCNIIMMYAPEVAAKDPNYTPSELNAHIAECTALRSLCYFYLIRAFRDVPYTTEAYTDDSQQMIMPATKFDEVLDKLIASLEAVKSYAIQKYPSNSSLGHYYQTGRITQLAIYAMLADMYLWKGDYANCVKYADLVIQKKSEDFADIYAAVYDLSIVNNFPIFPNAWRGYSDMYGMSYSDLFVDGASQESIFELTYVDDVTMPHNSAINALYGNVETNGYVKPSDYVGTDVKNNTPKVFNNKYDARAYQNFRFNTSGDVLCINKYTTQSEMELVDPTTNTFYQRSYWGKRYAKDENASNFIIYRLTDVMLLKAEALTQMMSDAATPTEADLALRDEAFWICNAVNKRSLMQSTLTDTLKLNNYTTKENITELVYNERNRELMFEGKRYFDLVRHARRDGNTDYLRSKAKLKSVSNASIIESQLSRMDAIYWPYNREELIVNPELKQNPAFGSGENGNYENNAKR